MDVQSRETQPRLDLTHLAKTLNALEEDDGIKRNFKWEVAGVTDTGPLLRLHDLSASARLTKAERYQHPDQRKINPSSIPQSAFLETVKSYLTFGQKEMARYAKINPLAGREVDCVGDGRVPPRQKLDVEGNANVKRERGLEFMGPRTSFCLDDCKNTRE